MHTESAFLFHQGCPSCGSSDASAVYSDGHSFCHRCGAYTHKGETTAQEERQRVTGDLIRKLSFRTLGARGLTEETCTKWGYGVAKRGRHTVQVAPYYDAKGKLVAQKLRTSDKQFSILGDMKQAGLFGAQLWRDGGRMVVVTEGEIDALSVSQVQDNKWPVVSIPNGASGALKAVKKNLEWLERFETVVFMFDQDEPGTQAALECAAVLTPNKAKIASLPLKDANAMLQAGRAKEIVDAMWGAKTYRPDGILGGEELWAAVTKVDTSHALQYPYFGLNEKTRGCRTSEIVTFTAGSGIGKSLICREIVCSFIAQGETVGYIALEESVKRTVLGLMSIGLNKPLHIDMGKTTHDELRKHFDAAIRDKVYCYDHFGSLDSETLISKIRYMARGLGCRTIVLDHISIVISGLEDGDERRTIDNLMTKLRSLAQELEIRLLLVSHLKRPEGRGHEDGAQTTLGQLRGSASIGQLSDIVIGLERNQQASEDERNITTARVLKNRHTGDTGVACQLVYAPSTGRLSEGEFTDETDIHQDEEF